MPTALEIAQVSGSPFLPAVLNFTRKDVPIFNSFDVSEFKGTRFKTLVIEQAGAEPTFVNLGEGYVPTGTPMTVREFAASRINMLTKVQESTARVWDDENLVNTGYDYFTLQQMENVKSALLHVEKVMIYGTLIDAKGHPGLKQLTPPLISNTLTYASRTAPEADGYARSFINAGGTTGGTASSIYFVKFGPLDAQMKMGGPTGLAGFLKPSDRERVRLEGVDPADNITKHDKFIVADGEGYTGLSVAGNNEVGTVKIQQSVRRIGNVTGDAGKGCTEALLDYGLDALPASKRPSVIYMSPRSIRQYRDSKTAATVFLMGGGDAKNATLSLPTPEFHREIPIIVSENILSTDAIEVPT